MSSPSPRTRVLLNDFTRQWEVIRAPALAALSRVGASGWYILGQEVHRFENKLAELWGVSHAIGVGNGLDALEIALRGAGLKAGEFVLTTPLSAFATTLAIVRAGGVPVFVDVDDSGLLNLELCWHVLKRDKHIRWLLPVHLYGHAIDLQSLEELKHQFDLRVVEDCAQSIGARSKGRPTGTVGQVAATSFYPTKNLGAIGDAGAVLTSDAAIAEKARALRHYGQTATYVHEHLGLNSRLDELHAAILHDAMLPNLAQWTNRRRSIATAYRQGIRNPWLTLPPVPPGSDSVWHLFPVLVPAEKRPDFVQHLAAMGVQTGTHYPRLIPNQAALAAAGRFQVLGNLSKAERFAREEVSLPIHPFLTDEEVSHVIAACNVWEPA